MGSELKQQQTKHSTQQLDNSTQMKYTTQQLEYQIRILEVSTQQMKHSTQQLQEDLRAAALQKCKSRCSGLGSCKGFSFYYSSANHGYVCSPKSSIYTCASADRPHKCDLLKNRGALCFYVRKPQQYWQVRDCTKISKDKTKFYLQ